MTRSPRHRTAAATLLALLGLALAACPGNGQKAKTPDDAPDAAAKAVKPAEGDAAPPQPKDGSREVELIAPKAPTVLFLAGLKGYTEPCGCTLDILVGGIDRITGYIDAYRDKAGGALMLDAGNTLFDEPQLEPHRVAQEKAKSEVIVDGLLAMDVAATTPGPNDFALGKLFYLDAVRARGVEVLAANVVESEGLALGPGHIVREVSGMKVGVIGVVDPDLFAGVEGLEFSDPVEAAKAEAKALKDKKIDALVIVDHGNLAHAKKILEAVPQAHFVIVGHQPRETDAVDTVAGGHTLEAFDQGRYLGVLHLYGRGQSMPETFKNGRTSSKAEVERVERRIEQVQSQIERVRANATDGETPPILKTLQKQLTDLKAKKAESSKAAVDLPKEGAAFVYRPIPMEPGYPVDAKMKEARQAFNEELKALNTKNVEPIPPVPDGQPTYVGTEKCATCHVAAYEFWKKTSHAHAVQTLTTRNKLFDGNCVGCHVTGYRKPGGSVLGKLEYTATVNGTAFTKKLQDVGCESCHGPGSHHIKDPAEKDKKIALEVGPDVCTTCHNTEHSTTFDYDSYVQRITGEGHPMKTE